MSEYNYSIEGMKLTCESGKRLTDPDVKPYIEVELMNLDTVRKILKPRTPNPTAIQALQQMTDKLSAYETVAYRDLVWYKVDVDIDSEIDEDEDGSMPTKLTPIEDQEFINQLNKNVLPRIGEFLMEEE